MRTINRRTAVAATAAWGSSLAVAGPPAPSPKIQVELPRCRVPLSFIIDDSTCLVNMGKFCMPQFAATYPDRSDYQLPWRQWPDEIPDAFVREFGSWCGEQGVRGKYSIVPYPACVGWLDRTLPGWSKSQLDESLKLVRDLMVPNWDIHPEMITHTRVIDLKTGRPFADFSPSHMENSYPQQDISVDYLASYLAYALRILKNCDLPCEGITTPGGFGNRVKDKLPQAVAEAVRDVYSVELPHYFKYVAPGDESTEPKLEAMSGVGTEQLQLTVNVPAGTGDWFGGWEVASLSDADKYCNADATAGRMVELIERQQPAVMLCHWPGMYCNGSLEGYRDFQKVVVRLHERFHEQTQWMKVSEIARYWAARELTQLQITGAKIAITAPFTCRQFTIRLPISAGQISLHHSERDADSSASPTSRSSTTLTEVSTLASLDSGCFTVREGVTYVCWDLQAGQSNLHWQ